MVVYTILFHPHEWTYIHYLFLGMKLTSFERRHTRVLVRAQVLLWNGNESHGDVGVHTRNGQPSIAVRLVKYTSRA